MQFEAFSWESLLAWIPAYVRRRSNITTNSVSARGAIESTGKAHTFGACSDSSRALLSVNGQFIPVGCCREKAVIGAVRLFLLRGGLQLQGPSTPHWEVGAQ